jgi:uncharacterized repeat protein (TIGR01451 family)
MVSNIFIAAGSDGTVFFYDHWEDGYDPDPVNPAAGSTTVMGVLDAGATQTFPSDIDPALIGSLDELYYDGRDRITIQGEDANVIRLVNASGYDQGNGQCIPERRSGWLAAAWEVHEVAEWGTEYHTIVGEDLRLGLGGDIQDHNFAGMEVMAWQDDTSLVYNNGDPVVLNAGQTFFVPGENGGSTGAGVKSDDLIVADKPVQVQMMTGSCNDPVKIVSAHGYTLIPRRFWGRAYWAPVPGFDRTEYCALDPDQWDVANPQIDTDIYLHNPSSDLPIQVTVQSGENSETITIDSLSTVSVLRATGWSDLAIDNVGTYLYSDSDFWGLVAVDSATGGLSGSDDFDWGYSLLPEAELSSQAIIGYGPGRMFENDHPDAQYNGNVAFVVAAVTTTVYVDLNQDGLPDPFDMDGDSELDTLNAWGEEAWDEPTSALGVEVGAGQVLRVADAFDDQLRGARIYTKSLDEHIAVAWGQDPCSAYYLQYLDLGYTVLSSPVPGLSKEADLALDADATDDISPGDILTYTLLLENNGRSDMSEVWLTDTLPYEDSVFVRDSLDVSPLAPSRTLYRDGAVWGTNPITGAQAFSVYWPTIVAGQVVTITFRSQILSDTPASKLVNEAVVVSETTDPVTTTVDTPIVRPNLELLKLVDRTMVSRGELFTYTLIVSNTGENAGAAVDTRIWDVLPPGVSYVSGTLAMQWPEEVVWYESEPISRATFFHGVYADDLDQDPGGSSGYSGSDGSLDWASDWTEVGENDGPALGDLMVVLDEQNSLSAPAYIWMGDLGGLEGGLTRQLDLSEFISPTVRFHRSGSPGIVGEYSLAVSGETVPGSTEQYEGEYGFAEFQLPVADYGLVTLGLMVNGMGAGDVYRFDHLSVFEKQAERWETVDIPQRYSRLDPRSVAGIDPVSYNPVSRSMIVTDSLRLPAQGVARVTFTAMFDPLAEITETLYLTNTAYVNAGNWPETLEDTAVVTVPANTADLVIIKTDEPERVIKAEDRFLTYTLAYANLGPVDAQNVTLTDTLPNEVTFVGVVSQPAGWTGPTEGTELPVTLTWVTPTLVAGQSGEIVVLVEVDEDFSGVLTNWANISTDTPESNYENNEDQEETEVDTLADVTITKIGQPERVSPGDQLVYTLVYTNNGPDPALNVVVSDTLIPEVEFVAASPDPRLPVDDVLWWELGTLEVNETGTIVVTTTVTAEARATFTNTVEISTTTPETNEDNNWDDDPTDVGMANLVITKVGHPDLVAEGSTLAYTLVYTNEGPDPALNVVVSDTLIPELRYVIADPEPLFLEDDVLWWELGTLEAGYTGQIVVTTTVTSKARATFTNTVQISTTTLEGNYDDNWDDDPTDVGTDIKVTKTASREASWPDPDLSNHRFFYTILCENVGTVTARDVVVEDRLPDELIYESATPPPTSQQGQQVIWELENPLAPKEVFTITLHVRVRPDITESKDITNTVWISTTTPEPEDQEPNTGKAPTAVDLLEFTAQPVPGAVWVKWITLLELDTWGYYVYRGESDQYDDAALVAYRPGPGRGRIIERHEYTFRDVSIVPSSTYYYWLVEEELAADGGTRLTVYGPREVTTLPLPDDLYQTFISIIQMPVAAGAMAGDSDE